MVLTRQPEMTTGSRLVLRSILDLQEDILKSEEILFIFSFILYFNHSFPSHFYSQSLLPSKPPLHPLFPRVKGFNGGSTKSGTLSWGRTEPISPELRLSTVSQQGICSIKLALAPGIDHGPIPRGPSNCPISTILSCL